MESEDRILEFDIMARNELCGSVYVNFGTGELRVAQYTDDPVDRPFTMEPVTIPDIMDFFEYRCFPRTRVNCDQLLEDLGLVYYSPLAIVRKTHGIQFDDFTWVRFKGETIRYDDIKIRD
jgi:hypothetical protein